MEERFIPFAEASNDVLREDEAVIIAPNDITIKHAVIAYPDESVFAEIEMNANILPIIGERLFNGENLLDVSKRSRYAQLLADASPLRYSNGKFGVEIQSHAVPVAYESGDRIGLVYDLSEAKPYSGRELSMLLNGNYVQVPTGIYGEDYVFYDRNKLFLEKHDISHAVGIALRMTEQRFAVRANGPVSLSTDSRNFRDEVRQYHHELHGEYSPGYITATRKILNLHPNICVLLDAEVRIGEGTGHHINSRLLQGKDTKWEIILELTSDAAQKEFYDYSNAWVYGKVYPQKIDGE